jgi:molecular chaperone DnaK
MGFGIDFGTTNSAVVYDQTTLLDTGGNRPFPSVVAIDNVTGDVLCGHQAKERRGELSDGDWTVITSVKRHLDRGTVFRAGARTFAPRQIAAELFKALATHVRANVHRSRGESLGAAVVSIPVGFAPARRRMLREAAHDVGVSVADFVSEPTAAYFGCKELLGDASRVAVFDWGGGTLDVCVLAVRDGQVVELAAEGREEAGDDLDLAIAHWAHRRIVSGDPDAPPFEAVPGSDRDRLLQACEAAKIELSDAARSEVGEDLSTDIRLGNYLGRVVVEPLSCATLSELASGMIRRAIQTLDIALQRAAQKDGNLAVDCVLLTGGSSKLVSLERLVHERFPGRCIPAPNPSWAVAQGASWLSTNAGSYQLAQHLCLVLSDGVGHVLARPGDAFDGTPRPYHLGLVEDADTAELVFAEALDDERSSHTSRRMRQIGNLAVPMQGFWEERLRLEATLTRDLTFRVDAQSENGNAEDRRSWEFPQLQFAYRLPPKSSRGGTGVRRAVAAHPSEVLR